MSTDESKAFSTFMLWLVLGVIGFKALSTEMEVVAAILVVVSILGMALIGMSFIWVLPEAIKARTQIVDIRQDAEKSKRGIGSQREQQLALLMDLMDDDELAEFKERLKRRVLGEEGYADGELPLSDETLAALLEEESGRRLRR